MKNIASTTVYLPEAAERRLEIMRAKYAALQNQPDYSKAVVMSHIIQSVLRSDRTGARVRQLLELPE